MAARALLLLFHAAHGSLECMKNLSNLSDKKTHTSYFNVTSFHFRLSLGLDAVFLVSTAGLEITVDSAADVE